MNLEKIIRSEIEKLLNTQGFELTEKNEQRVTFKSEKLTIRFVYNPHEFSLEYWIKHINSDLEYENAVVEAFLKINREASFEETTQEQKVIGRIRWFARYFRENQRGFLDGNDAFFNELESFLSEQTTDYNNELQLEFIKEQIHKAWQEKDYRKLANLETSGLKGISQSEMKKIGFAKRKIENP